MTKLSVVLLLSPLLAAAAGCDASKTADPLSPSVAGPIPGVNITAPKTVEPASAKVPADRQPLTLIVENASTNSPRPLTYEFDLATDAGFSNKVLSREGITPGSDGRTALKLSDPLQAERTYYWRARAQDGANTGPYSAAANFDVFTPTSIDTPIPVMPINNVRTENLRPRFMVTNAPRLGLVGAVSYVFELSDTDTFANKLAVWTIPEQPNQTAFDAPQDLQYGKQYFWRVHAFNGGTSGPSSANQVFQTPSVTINTPQLIFPANGTTVDDLHPRFLWANATRTGAVGPVTYSLELSESDTFATKLAVWAVGEQPNQTSLVTPVDLAYGKQYFWHVRAVSQLAIGAWSATQGFRTQTLTLGQAQLVLPAAGVTVDSLHPTFLWNNAPRSGSVGPVTYSLELSDTDSFANKLAVWAVGEQPNQTSLVTPQDLGYSKQYFWHVRALSALATGGWSAAQAFETPEPPPPPPPPPPPAPPAPGPNPGPNPGPGAPCGPPYPSTPLEIVQCQRSNFGQSMTSADLVNLLRGVARDLNAAGVRGGPFGILQKKSGNQCNGYSCDIICSGQGSSQQQWDVLLDVGGANSPTWNGPHSGSNIRVDYCEAQ